MIKYSVIGTSWITRSFIEGAALHPELSLLGVYSRNRERGEAFADSVGAELVFSSLEELISSKTELVYVASPNSCHYDQCKALLSAGKHVLCEKPITTTLSEYKELSDLADKMGVIYFEAIMYMHSPGRKILKDAVEGLGNIRCANIDFSQLSSKYPALVRGELPNIFNPEMKTGALNDLGIYCVYPVVDIFGEPENIVAVQSFLSTGADGCGAAVFIYPEKIVNITYSKVGQSRTGSQIMGDRGTITIGSISQTDDIYLYDNHGGSTELFPDIDKKFHMGDEALSAIRFINEPEEYKAFYMECRRVNESVLRCMEKMRVENA